MKKLMILLLLSVLASCVQNNDEIELIKPTTKNYIFIPRLFSPDGRLQTEVYNISAIQVKKMSKAVEEVKKVLAKSMIDSANNSSPKGIPFSANQFVYTLYIDEFGDINKVVAINSRSEDVDKYLVEQMKDWKMEIFKSDNRAIKYSMNWEFGLFVPEGKNYYSLANSNLKVGEVLDIPNKDDFFTMVEEMPSPIGGMVAIQAKVKYPEVAKRAGIQGRVYVKAFIDEKGNVVETEILRGVGSGLDLAAIRAIEAVKFNPGKQKGKPVKVQVSIPIMFKLN